jgi:hypothetical protein
LGLKLIDGRGPRILRTFLAGCFIGRLITALGTLLGLNIEPSSTTAYLLGSP